MLETETHPEFGSIAARENAPGWRVIAPRTGCPTYPSVRGTLGPFDPSSALEVVGQLAQVGNSETSRLVVNRPCGACVEEVVIPGSTLL